MRISSASPKTVGPCTGWPPAALCLGVWLLGAVVVSDPADAELRFAHDGGGGGAGRGGSGDGAFAVRAPFEGVVSEVRFSPGASVEENNTVANIESLLKAAKESGVPVFISPHYYYPHDHGWRFEGALEALMHQIGMFDRVGPLSVEGFDGSGAD